MTSVPISPRPTVPHATGGPLFADTGLKLGVFGLNVSSAGAVTAAADRHEIDWDQNLRVVQQAERAGLEAVIPFSRWRGFEGATNPWGQSYDPYTWSAALAASTSRITLFATSHCLTVSPVMAAKQIATIDTVSGGRVGLNVVAGWFAKELAMFGAQALDHDERYAYSEEWLEIVLRLWAGEEFDHRGPWLTVPGGYSRPGPVQQPHPPIMSAAFSARGHRFAARCADLAFVSAFDAASAGATVREVRELAAGFGRTPSVWIAASVVCADTDQEARDLVRRWSEVDADEVAVGNAIDWTMGGVHMPAEQHRALAASVASTMAGYPLVGSPERIAEQLGQLHAAGVDGVALTMMNYETGVPRFIDQVLPILERTGIRRAPAEPVGDCPRTTAAILGAVAPRPCPCGLPAPFDACCGRYLGDTSTAAPTAEALMRSRYTAFARGDAEHLLRTWHPSTRPATLTLDPAIRWTRLEVLDRVGGSLFDTDGVVEFRAHHREGPRVGVLHERSRFVRENGRWLYRDGSCPTPADE